MYLFSFLSFFFFKCFPTLLACLMAMVLPFWLLLLLQSHGVSVSVECTLAYEHASLSVP